MKRNLNEIIGLNAKLSAFVSLCHVKTYCFDSSLKRAFILLDTSYPAHHSEFLYLMQIIDNLGLIRSNTDFDLDDSRCSGFYVHFDKYIKW